MEIMIFVIAAIQLATLGVILFVMGRFPGGQDMSKLEAGLDMLNKQTEQLRSVLADELTKNRSENLQQAGALRSELSQSVQHLSNSIGNRITEVATLQKGQLDSFVQHLMKLTETNERNLQAIQKTLGDNIKGLNDDNQKKLDEIRRVVDHELQSTLEKRLGESFKQVSERLEAVHKGLGEMQTLAVGVGDLKKVLSNVKTRGTWGEVALGNLLEQLLTAEQYSRDVSTKKGSADRVEFAIKLPGKDSGAKTVYLPIDAKFPQEDYMRLLEAQDAGDAEAVKETAGKLEKSVKAAAKTIMEKYIDPPNTTDFAMMYLPTEGLYAEVLRRTGLFEQLQREYKVIVAGPTTLSAILNSLQMGFRTLAIEKRSSEVWSLLSGVKNEFGKFGDLLDKTQQKLGEASKTIDEASKRTRAIEKKMNKVQDLPVAETQQLFSADELL